MKMLRETLAYAFSVLSLGGGLGLLTYVVCYNTLRSRYLGDEPAPGYIYANTAYYSRMSELTTISTLSAVGIGLLSASLTTFYLLARANRSRAAKSPIPDI